MFFNRWLRHFLLSVIGMSSNRNSTRHYTLILSKMFQMMSQLFCFLNNNNNNNKIWYDLRISICNIIIYLETKFCTNRWIFVFWWPFWNQNSRHCKPKWSPCGGACLTPCKYPFPLKSFHFWILSNLFLFLLFLYWWPFWNGGLLENFKNQYHNF